jgi:hypothetical protein
MYLEQLRFYDEVLSFALAILILYTVDSNQEVYLLGSANQSGLPPPRDHTFLGCSSTHTHGIGHTSGAAVTKPWYSAYSKTGLCRLVITNTVYIE